MQKKRVTTLVLSVRFYCCRYFSACGVTGERKFESADVEALLLKATVNTEYFLVW